MNHIQRGLSVFVFMFITTVVGLLPAAQAGAQTAKGEIVAFQAGPSGLVWRPLIPFEHGVLTVAGPDGTVFREEFGAGASPAFNPFVQPGYHAPDGSYVWEVWLGRPSLVHPQVRAAAKAARESGDADVEAEHRAASTQATQVQSGAFLILNGAIVPSTLVEPRGAPRGRSSHDVAPAFRLTEWIDDPSIRPVDQVINDDLIVQGSACIGLDCVNNESFGFDTIRLKENNTRIKFEDTSTATGFPSNDWQLTANDSASGGANKFSIDDVTGAKTPFTITAGAPTNSLFVDSTGRVGFRTGTPVLDLHAATGNTPALRFEQNSSGGFTAQTWDVAGNEANFFVRDVTGGSRLPLRIRPGAPTSSIDIAASGNVGVGTASPSGLLHLLSTSANGTSFFFQNSDTGGKSWRMLSTGTNNTGGAGIFGLVNATDDPNNFKVVVTPAGRVGIGTSAPANPLQMASGAFVSVGGVWTDVSSRESKDDIQSLTADEARAALSGLSPVKFVYKVDPTERHVGFVAEDVPDLVATKDRKALSPMDIVAVLTRVVQEQQKTVETQHQLISELATKLSVLEGAQGR
jgi:hypothetical protein